MRTDSNYNVLSVGGFEADLIKVAKKYPSVVENVDFLFQQFEQGNLVGDAIPKLNLKGDKVFKTRLANPDANKGKRAGFRIIWFLVTSDNDIYPLTIYSKSDKEDISIKEIERLARSLKTV